MYTCMPACSLWSRGNVEARRVIQKGSLGEGCQWPRGEAFIRQGLPGGWGVGNSCLGIGRWDGLSWLEGGSPAGAGLRGVGVGGRGGRDPPSGDPREALGCWGGCCCRPGMGEAQGRVPTLPTPQRPRGAWCTGRQPGWGAKGLASSPLGSPTHSVAWQWSLALLWVGGGGWA